MLSWLIKSLHVIILELAGETEKNSLQLPSCKLQPGLWGWGQSSYTQWVFLWLMLWGLVEGFSAPSIFHSLFQASFPTTHCDLIMQWWRRVSHLLGLRFKFSQQSSVCSPHSQHMSHRTILWLHFFSISLPKLVVLAHKSTSPMAQFTPPGTNGNVYLETAV